MSENCSEGDAVTIEQRKFSHSLRFIVDIGTATQTAEASRQESSP